MLLLQIAAWYALSGAYNVYNGKLKRFPYPFVISILELAVGAIFVLPLYILGIRKAPKLSLPSLLHILPIGAYRLIVIYLNMCRFMDLYSSSFVKFNRSCMLYCGHV